MLDAGGDLMLGHGEKPILSKKKKKKKGRQLLLGHSKKGWGCWTVRWWNRIGKVTRGYTITVGPLPKRLGVLNCSMLGTGSERSHGWTGRQKLFFPNILESGFIWSKFFLPTRRDLKTFYKFLISWILCHLVVENFQRLSTFIGVFLSLEILDKD